MQNRREYANSVEIVQSFPPGKKLSAVFDRIDKGEGAMGSLIGDRELKEDLRSTVKELNELVKDIKKNPKKYFEFSIF